MHLMKDHEGYIMYGNPIKASKNPEKLLLNALYGSNVFHTYNPAYCNCTNDIKTTKEAAAKMNNHNIRKTNDPRMNNYNTGNIYAVINGKAYIPETINMRTGFRENMEFEFTVTTDPRYAVENTMLSIKNAIFNPPATIVFWGDGSKTVVKCQEGDEYDPEKGLAMAFFKRMHGNKGRYCEEIKKWVSKSLDKVED